MDADDDEFMLFIIVHFIIFAFSEKVGVGDDSDRHASGETLKVVSRHSGSW